MNPDSRLLDDIARVAGGAVNIASGMQQQLREEVKVRLEEMASRMDLVPREDFDQARAMIARLRSDLDALEGRVKKLESKKVKSSGKTVKKSAGKTVLEKAKKGT
jgi:BMFP domain-containing protein YqiC